jgi:hypothetical protein
VCSYELSEGWVHPLVRNDCALTHFSVGLKNVIKINKLEIHSYNYSFVIINAVCQSLYSHIPWRIVGFYVTIIFIKRS